MKRVVPRGLIVAICISFAFFIAYTIISVLRQQHFLSGYDLAVIDQAIWKYSQFKAPISTNQTYAFTSILNDHVELIFILIAPLFWLWNSIYVLYILQAAAICSSAVAVYLLAKVNGLKTIVALALVVSFLGFYGIQNAIWSDVHSIIFGVSFLTWFIYCMESRRLKLSWLFFFLTIICKEDLALLTLLVSAILFITQKRKDTLLLMGISILYLYGIFYIYFPHFIPGGYRFQSKDGLLAHINIANMWNSQERRDVLVYSSISFGFLPLLSPLQLLPAVFDLAKYFILGNAVVTGAQNIFEHYRSSLAILLVWPTIYSIAKWKWLNNAIIAVYLILCCVFVQFVLHLPLSYLTKSWFLTTPKSVHSINAMLAKVPNNASIVTQINILPHLSHRDLEFIMWPNIKEFKQNSPCGHKSCPWFYWAGKPNYMIADVSSDWDSRYWLTNQKEFIQGVQDLEKENVIRPITQDGTTKIYQVLSRP